MANNARCVSLSLLNIAHENGDLISNLKLQKLLYYAQAWYLVNNAGRRLFDDEIQAWQYGPVVPAVYNEFKIYNSYPIDFDKIEPKEFLQDEHVLQYLQDFACEYFRYSATELVTLTHQEQPWKTAIAKGYNAVIDTKEMYKFYTQLLKKDAQNV